MSISTTIKSIQDIMRQDAGVDGDAQRISQLVWMIFLKIFDDNEQVYEWEEGYRSPIPERLRWRNWAANSESISLVHLSNTLQVKLWVATCASSRLWPNKSASSPKWTNCWPCATAWRPARRMPRRPGNGCWMPCWPPQ
jgi:hypothetical protein